MKKKIITIVTVIFGLWILSNIFALFIGFDTHGNASGGNVAVIPIKGVISLETSQSLLGEAQGASSEVIVKDIEKAQKDPNIKAILFDINSPGGYPVATDEIGQKIKSSNKLTVAVIREMGTSGAYWIASACDHIIANRMSVTGSIGVYGSYLEFSDFLERFNVTYQRFVAGKFKDIGTPYKEPSDKERDIYQELINKLHDFFIKEVSENRGLSLEETRKVANGLIYLGVEAKDLGLIDSMGNKKTAVRFIEEKINRSVRLVEYKHKASLTDILGGIYSNNLFPMGKFIYSKEYEPLLKT
ncbi:signal peptide peptidase SppA [Candidatus Woesearchaeota archaeon]|nr:signal peptide peptidase SppA [Candidatus Woesearchaeota archaeon]